MMAKARMEPTPLIERIGGKIGRLTAAAVMPWPGVVLEQLISRPRFSFNG